MRSTNLVFSAGAAIAVVAALNIPLTPSSDLIAANQAGTALKCDMTQYKANTGLTTALDGNQLTVDVELGRALHSCGRDSQSSAARRRIRDLSVRREGWWRVGDARSEPDARVSGDDGHPADVEQSGECHCRASASM